MKFAIGDVANNSEFPLRAIDLCRPPHCYARPRRVRTARRERTYPGRSRSLTPRHSVLIYADDPGVRWLAIAPAFIPLARRDHGGARWCGECSCRRELYTFARTRSRDRRAQAQHLQPPRRHAAAATGNLENRNRTQKNARSAALHGTLLLLKSHTDPGEMTDVMRRILSHVANPAHRNEIIANCFVS